MSSTTVDSRVVEMRFDNKQFENNVQTTMSTLDKLKQSLNLSGASKGLENVSAAAKNCDMSVLSGAVETVRMKFSALQVMGVTALANITNSAVNAGKRIVSALTIDPMKSGLQEYETQINAVQTILANTQHEGTNIKQVNAALDELNEYADKTIYNFTEMTRNIGTFTAAGVDLNTSVDSIKGIANLAAVSGSTSQQASTAMYQLSQALAAGKVSLMDWNSVVNAGMGGKVFQDALKRTATAMGTNVDALIKKYGSFRESLTKGNWLTSEVLTETLKQFSGAYTEADLIQQGYSKSQAKEIVEMAKTATDAATKVKTFTQLIDTLKEALQSGWALTWRTIIGDFEEAKELWTGVSEVLGGFIEESANARNAVVQGWADGGGRTMAIEAISNAFEGLVSIIKPIHDAFREIFPRTTAEQLLKITESIRDLTEKFKLSETTSENLKRTFKGMFALLDIGVQAIKAIAGGFVDLIGFFAPAREGLLGFTAHIGDFIVNIDEAVKSSDAFNKVIEGIGTFLKPIADGVKAFGKSISETFSEIADKAEIRFSPLTALGEGIKGIFIGIADAISTVAPWLSSFASKAGDVFGGFMDNITSSIQNADYNTIFDIISGGVLTAIGLNISKFIKSAGGIMDNAGGFLDKLKGILSGVSDALSAFTESLKAKTLLTIASAIGILAASLVVLSLIDSEKLTTALTAISVLFVELFGSMAVFGKIADGKNLGGMIKISSAMVVMSSALLILSAAMKVLSTLSWNEVAKGLVAVTGGLGALVIAINLLPKKNVEKAAKAIKKLSSALLVFSVAVKVMGSLSWNELAVGLVGTVGGLAALIGAVYLLPKDIGIKALGMVTLATALTILGGALKIMGSLSWEEMARGLTALVGALTAITIAMNLMSAKIIITSVGLVAVTTALLALSGVLKIMSSMSWKEIAKGLVTLGGSLAIIAIGVNAMRSALPGAAALLIVSAAIAVFTPAMMALGSMDLAEIGKALLALAGAFTVVGLAGLVLSPLVPTLLALSGAMVLFGVGVAAVGVGVLAFATGMTALAASGAAGALAITTIVSSLISLIPYLLEQIGVGIIKLCEAIAGGADAICEAIKVIILAVVDALVASVPALVDGIFALVDHLLLALVEHTPIIVGAIFDFLIELLEGIAAKLPDLIQAGVDVLMAFFTGVIDALKSIDPNVLVNGIIAVGFMSALMVAMAAIASLTPMAMVGVLGAGVVITELALVLAAIGALAQIPGLEWLISEGGDFLQAVGTAIGKFLGGIAGGIAQGMTSALPQIGTDLSVFMTNIQPFIEGAKQIDPSAMDGVKSLVGVILALTGANILEGLTSWLTGGSSLTKFGEELASFAPNIKMYADTVKGIDASAVQASAIAAKSLSELASNLPNSGGLAGFFAGENDIGDFGAQLVPFGIGLKAYSLAVAGIDAQAISDSANAAKALADMASIVPNEGGVAAWFAGENSIATFGTNLISLGIGLKGYSLAIAGIDTEAIMASANAAKALAEMTSNIPNEGGVVSWFAGDNSIANFGDDLVALGTGLKGFSDEIDGVVPENLIAASKAAQALTEMTSNIPNEGGVASWFAGENSVADFADQLPVLGEGLKSFSDSIDGISPEKVTAASSAAKALAEMASVIPNEDGMVAWFTGDNSVADFADQLPVLGKGLKSFSDSVENIKPENVMAATNAAKALSEMADNIPNEGGLVSLFTGDNDISGFADGLPTLGRGLKSFSDSVDGITPENVTAAANATKTLAEMAASIPKEGGLSSLWSGDNDLSGFSTVLPALGKGLKGFSDSVTGIVPENVTAAANAAKILAQMADTTPENTDKLTLFGENLKSFGTSLKSYFQSTANITEESISGSSQALESVKTATTLDADKIKSSADAIDDMTTALLNASSITADSTSGFKSALSKLGEVSADAFVEAFGDIDSEMKDAGEDAIDNFVKGVEGNDKKAKDAAKTLAEDTAEAAENKSGSFKQAAKYLVIGFANGISENTWRAEAKSRAMASAAARAAERELDEHSPSKVGYRIGDFFGLAFVNAIGDYERKSYVAGSTMANSAKTGLSQAIGKIKNVIDSDMDMQPTIRPVLDLSNVKSNAGTIGSLLGIGSSIGIPANIGVINTMMNRYQNESDNEIVSAINKLRKDISDNPRSVTNIGDIRYDDGSTVSNAVRSLIRVAKVERRV